MLIPKPAQSAYDTADSDIREMLDRMIAELQAMPSWEQRSTQFLEIIDALELAFEGEDELGDEDADDEFDEDDDEFDEDEDEDDLDDDEDDEYHEEAGAQEGVNGWHGDTGHVPPGGGEDEEEVEVIEDFAEVLPFYVGAVLERLNESQIDRPEQAAFYLLSCHPEHIDAAQGWMKQPNNLKRFQKFVDATPDYEAILEMMDEHYGEEGDEDDE